MLRDLVGGRVFEIPDYQRGYAWDTPQWNDLIDDIDALVIDKQVRYHYTGTIVTYNRGNKVVDYERSSMQCVEVVDGQQRLTSICLYLSVIIHALVRSGEKEYGQDIPKYLYHDATCKLTLNNDTEALFFQLLRDGVARTTPITSHQKRLAAAHDHFLSHIEKSLADSTKGIAFVKNLFKHITGKLVFTYYEIEEETEIGMTFELMNSRGKDLSVLELLKNYLMHWISRNSPDNQERNALIKTVNNAWKDTYVNVGGSSGSESQCLRIAWTLYCHHLPKNWQGYKGFKEKSYIPLRDFSVREINDVKDFLNRFSNGLAEISHHYAIIISPSDSNVSFSAEFHWLSRVHNAGNIANFLPLMVAARIRYSKKEITEQQYTNLLKAMECFSYRVFLVEGKRSNAGKSSFYRWGKELFRNEQTLNDIITWIYGLIRYYVTDNNFIEKTTKTSNWYARGNLLKYTLFEYEKHLIDKEGKGQKPRISWSDLTCDSTIEHILPQNPRSDSYWIESWMENDRNTYLHDIGNLVLTRNNSEYSNKDFIEKRGNVGTGVGYVNSDIRQERKLAAYQEWNVENLKCRRQEIDAWIIDRWGIKDSSPPKEISELDDEDDTVISI